jgi:hypothetical protein
MNQKSSDHEEMLSSSPVIDWSTCELTITEEVKYVGEGEDPANDPYMIAYKKALESIYQPERI